MRSVIRAILNRISWLKLPSISMGITDVVEIIILSYLVYKLLQWIKATRAWTLLKGILTIVICVSMVYIFQMDTLIYIVNRGITIAIIAVIVVFQPEIRKVLEQIGRAHV